MRIYYWSYEENTDKEVHDITDLDALWQFVDEKKEPINEVIAATGQYILELSANEGPEGKYMVLTWIDKED